MRPLSQIAFSSSFRYLFGTYIPFLALIYLLTLCISPCRSPMLGERNVVYVVFIYRIRILRIFRKLRILKILKFLNILTYILIAFNTITIHITDTFSIDYADLPNYLITSSPHFHGLLPTCLQPSSSVSVEKEILFIQIANLTCNYYFSWMNLKLI